jgi:hypothetical protein
MPAWAILLVERIGRRILNWALRQYLERHKDTPVNSIPLKACPFCGMPEGAVKHINDGWHQYWVVRCQDCGAHGWEAGTVVQAMLGWNNRKEGTV